MGASVSGDLGRAEALVENMGWVAGADAAARVKVSDAALNQSDPYGDTIFTDAEYVEFTGRRYRVLSVQPIAASFVTPYTYYVWLQGAVKQ
jgi:hypothetical protein